LYVPASILLRAPPAENAEVQEEELDLLTIVWLDVLRITPCLPA